MALEGKLNTKKTTAPPRYKEAALVRELERRGIGRPATYAAILDNIADRGYVVTEKDYLAPTPTGELVVDLLVGKFSFADYAYTRDMEQDLDDVACGRKTYVEVVAKAHDRLQTEVDGFRKERIIACPHCGADLRHVVNKDKGYDFFGCSDRESCGAMFPNVDGKPGPRQAPPELTEHMCAQCGKPLRRLKGPKKDGSGEYDFFACADKACGAKYDNVDGAPTARKAIGEKTKHKCKKCKKPLLAKPTKTGGVWFACSAYPKCNARYWAKADGSPDYDNPPKN